MQELIPIYVDTLNKEISYIQSLSEGSGVPSESTGDGTMLLKCFSKGITSSGNPKYTGTLICFGEIKFNVWSNSKAYNYFENLGTDFQPRVVWIHYSITKYGLVVKEIMNAMGDPDDYIDHKYDPEGKINEFLSVLGESNITDNALTVIKTVLHLDQKDSVYERITKEYAAAVHHDSCPTGLLAHMTKCIRLYNGVKGAYAFLKDEKTNDLMVISLALHDLGKIYEMYDGVYMNTSYVTHRALGYEHLTYHKSIITELYGIEFFYMLASVLLQHHGEYGEAPKTVYALLAHLIDNMEAQLTSLDEMTNSIFCTTNSAGTQIYFNGSYLNVLS